MAQNDALQYGIKFVLDTQGMSAIVKQVEGTFKNLQLNLTAKNINISGLQEQFSGFEKIIKQLQAEFSKIGSTATSGDFTSMKGVINDVSKNVGKLTEQLVTLNQGLTSNLSNAVSAAMRESSGAIKQVVQDVNTLKATLDGVTAKVVVAAAEVGKETAKSNKFDVEGVEKAQLAYSNLSGKVKELYDIMMRVGQTPALSHLADSGENLFQRLKAIRQELMNIMTTGQTSKDPATGKGLTFGEFIKTADFKSAEQDFKVFVDGARQQIRALDRETAKAEKNAQKAVAKTVRNEADAEITRLNNLMKQLRQLQSEGLKGNANYKETAGYRQIEQAIQELQKYIELLRQAKREGQDIGNINLDRFSKDKSAATMEQISQAHRNAVSTAQDVVNSQERMAQAMQKANQAGFLQSQVLSDLKSMATQYLSIWGASSFVKEVAQITGELELQQRSLEVIIGSAGQAQEMFNNIKGLSQMSPFTFQDLLKSTRQLAAFGVQTKDLYDTMKSLSDLGAGLNVDVQRLILAYGHVKSSGVLTGIQRRQFETAGINITGEIAKLYNQRYERAGSDERVTSADIFKKITKREIGFGDVEAAIRSLTEEGGKFYNMQLRQYETLGGKLRNLRNNYNIMLDDIGKKYMELLTTGVDSLNSMMENWRTWEALIKSVTAALVAAKVASLALGKSMAGHRAASLTLMRDRINAQHLAALQGYTGTTRSNSMLFNRRTMLGMDYAGEINGSEMSKFQKIRSALYANVAPDARNAILTQQNMGKEYIANIRRLSIMANSTQTMTRLQGQWGLAFERLKVSANGFFASMRAGFAALATNPMVWIGAAIAGITALVNKANEIETAMEHSTENTKRIMKEDIENINSSLNPIKNSLFDDNGNFNKEALDKRGFQATFEELDEIMQNHDPLYKGHLFDLKQLGDESAIIKGMIKDIEDARTGKEMTAHNAGAVNMANTQTGYNGSLLTLGIGTQWSTLSEKMHQTEKDFEQLKSRLIIGSEDIEKRLKDTMPYIYDRWKASGMEFEDYMAHLALEMAVFNDTKSADNFKDAWLGGLSQLGKFHASLKDLIGDMDGVKNKMEDVAKVIAKGFDPKKSVDANVMYLQGIMDNLFSQEGFETKSPEMQDFFINLVLANVPEEEMVPAVRERLYEIMLKANLDEVIKSAIKDGSLDPNNIDSDAISLIEKEYYKLADKLIALNPSAHLRKAIATQSKDIFKDFKSNPAPAIRDFDRSWQKIYNAITDPNDPRKKLIAKFETVFKNSVNDYEFWAEMDKEMKTIRERLAQMRNIYTVVQKVKIKFDAIFDSKGAQKAIDEVVKLMTAKLQQGDYSDLGALRDVVKGLAEMRDMFKAAELSNRSLGTEDREKYENKQAKAADKAQKAAEKRQREQERAKEKAERAAEKAKRDQERAANEAERKEMERIRNRIQQLQDLRREYKDLRQYNSKEAAMRQTQERYRHDYGENGVLSDAELKAIEDYTKILDKEIEAIKGNKKILNEEHRKSLIEAARRAQSELNNVIFKEKSDEMLSTLNSDLQKLLKQYESAKKVIDATGDTEAAANISGIGEAFLKGGWLDNILESHLTSRFAALLQSYDLDPTKYVLDFKKVAGLDDKGIEEYVKDLIGDEQTGSLVQAISTWLKEYKRQYDNVGKSAVDAYAKAASAAMDYESQLQRINSELKEQNDLIDRSDASPEEKRRAKEINDSRAEIKRLEIGSSYRKFFDGIFDEPMAQMEAMRRVLEGAYARALRSGAISAEEYAKKIEEINKVMREATRENLDAWWNKGFFDTRTQEQRQNEMRNRGNALQEQGSDLWQQALQNGDQKGAKDALDMMTKGKQMVDGANKAALAMAIIDKVVHGIDKSIQGTVKAFGYLADALDALGEESETVAVIGDYLNTLGEMSSHVTASWDSFKSGDYFGASVEAFGAVTSLITGISQAHDNRLQRKIDRIKEDTEKMSNTLETIRSLRERELGYDNGRLRAALASSYQQRYGITDFGDDFMNRFLNGDSAAVAMYSYYSRYGGENGYEQELKLLEEQRRKLMEMYDLEDSKKKSNKEELENYQKQIAELDEQIMFFTEDLANQLWGIDLKGWADQLGDALMTAFENGSSAAAAFDDTVQEIMRGIVKNMLTVGILEPAMERLRVKLFGQNGQGGLLNRDDVQGSMGAVLGGLADWFNTEGPALMDAANEFYNGADDMMRQILGYGMRSNESSANTTTSITSTASEETMGIVAGYLSRLSQDVSVERIMSEMFVNGSWPDYIEQVTTANSSLSAIDRNTSAMMEMMRDGNGALYERVENMSRRLDNFANGIDRISVR